MENKPILNASETSPQSAKFFTGSLASSVTTLNAKVSAHMQCCGFIKKRHVLAIYTFFGFLFAYSFRASLSVAIVDMAKMNRRHGIATSQPNASSNTNITDTLEILKDPLDWSPALQGYILSSFFYGYIVTQLPAAFLTSRYGGKIFFGAGIGVCSFLIILMPAATHIGPMGVIILRTLQGLAQGLIYPALHALLSKWIPPSERSRIGSFVLSGSYVGTLISLSMGGVIGHALNWQSIFYVFGSLGLVWTVLWFYVAYDSPAEHDTIDEQERILIESSLIQNDNSVIPWTQMLKSSACWAIICAHFSENWGFYTILTEMPTFLSEVMHLKLNGAGILSSLPYLIMSIVLFVSGIVSDRLIAKKFTNTIVRKFFCCTGLIVQSFFMCMMIASNDITMFMIFSIMAVGFGGMPWASFGVNHLDIGAGYANVLMSITNTFATIPGIVSPILTGHLVTNNLRSEWNIVFGISALIFLLGATVYALIGTGEMQPWAHGSPSKSVHASFSKHPSSQIESDNTTETSEAYAKDNTHLIDAAPAGQYNSMNISTSQ